MLYTHILVPTDFSPAANQMLAYAFEEATQHHARLTLLHVLHHVDNALKRHAVQNDHVSFQTCSVHTLTIALQALPCLCLNAFEVRSVSYLCAYVAASLLSGACMAIMA
jgi:hypothetical protein